MDTCLSLLIAWPTRDALYKTMPQCFVDSFGYKTTVIIDCFEIFIDRPTNLLARAQTFSNYKHHNTVKVLMGISPQGTITFVSEALGGGGEAGLLTSFSQKTVHFLLPGDLVLADRGFTIHDEIMYYQADYQAIWIVYSLNNIKSTTYNTKNEIH